ncbi:MAG: DUF6808 domain-containing protein [Candidatus Cryptobacteroides sp.]
MRTVTVYVHDTVTVYKPTKLIRTPSDTVRVIVTKNQTDTVRDTVFVYLPSESVEWSDSLCTVYAHGIQLQVDSVTHYNSHAESTRMIMIAEKPPRWAVTLNAGYGFSKNGLSPYIGAGVSYLLYIPNTSRRRSRNISHPRREAADF